jgi:hypothetical protein
MQQSTDPKEKNYAAETGHPALDDKQQQTDPNITELKGFTDPNVPLEPTADQNKLPENDNK